MLYVLLFIKMSCYEVKMVKNQKVRHLFVAELSDWFLGGSSILLNTARNFSPLFLVTFWPSSVLWYSLSITMSFFWNEDKTFIKWRKQRTTILLKKRRKKRRMLYLTTHWTHFTSTHSTDIWVRTTQIFRKENLCLNTMSYFLFIISS